MGRFPVPWLCRSALAWAAGGLFRHHWDRGRVGPAVRILHELPLLVAAGVPLGTGRPAGGTLASKTREDSLMFLGTCLPFRMSRAVEIASAPPVGYSKL